MAVRVMSDQTDERWIAWLPLDEFVSAPRNPKGHALPAIAASIAQHGVVEVPTIDERTGRLVAGHGRVASLDAARAAGQDPPRGVRVDADGRWLVPAMRGWASVDDADAEAYLLRSNQTTIAGGWEPVDLDGMLRDLAIPPTTLGFPTDDIDALIASMLTPVDEPARPRLAHDDEPVNAPDPITTAGDVWLLGPHRIICGDATDRFTWPDAKTAHLVVADPPYFRKVDEEWDDQWASFEDFQAFLATTFAHAADAMHDRGTAACFCSADFVWHTEYEMRQRFQMFNHIVWFKGHDLGQAVDQGEMRRWRPRSERILFGEVSHAPDALLAAFTRKTGHIAARVAYADIRERLVALRDAAGVTNRAVDDMLGTVGMSGHYFGGSQWALPTEEAWEKIAALFTERGVPDVPTWAALRGQFDAERGQFDAERGQFDAERRQFDAELLADQLTDVWQVAAPSGDERFGHATPKPVGLYRKIIGSCARPGDLVVDPFAGTGPSLIAAHDHGAIAHLVEQDPAFVDVICARWQRHTGVLPVRERDGAAFDFTPQPVAP